MEKSVIVYFLNNGPALADESGVTGRQSINQWINQSNVHPPSCPDHWSVWANPQCQQCPWSLSLPSCCIQPPWLGGLLCPFSIKGFEGTAELTGNHGQAFHLVLNGVSSEVAFIPFGLEIFVWSTYSRSSRSHQHDLPYTRQQYCNFRKAQLPNSQNCSFQKFWNSEQGSGQGSARKELHRAASHTPGHLFSSTEK